MFNDLPENLKNEFKKQYYIRLTIVTGLFIILVQVVSMFFIFPSWTLSVSKKQELTSSIDAFSSSTINNRSGSGALSISTTNQILHILNINFGYPHAIPLYNAVLLLKKPGVQLSKFSYSSKSDTDALMSIEGIASTREVLVTFVKDLKSSGSFTSVDLPVSNLAQDTHINFVISIVISKKS